VPSVLHVVSASSVQELGDLHPPWAELVELLDDQRVLVGSPDVGYECVKEVVLVPVAALAGSSPRHVLGNPFPGPCAESGDQCPKRVVFLGLELASRTRVLARVRVHDRWMKDGHHCR
jgi:hypothetical protein